MYRNIKVSIAVLQTAAVILVNNIRILVIPFISFAFIAAFISGWAYCFGYLCSCANIVQPTDGSQLKTINFDGVEEVKWQIAVWIFGLFWGIELLVALFQYVIIVGVCCWYFTSSHDSRGSFSVSKGFWWSLRYNFGSLCFGSFLLAVIWMIRIVFEYIEKKTKAMMGDNAAAKCIVTSVRCCLDCFHRFVKFLNENAYIQVALHGDNFCGSAMNAFSLAVKHSGSFFVTNGIGSLIAFLGKMAISVSNVLVAFIMMKEI